MAVLRSTPRRPRLAAKLLALAVVAAGLAPVVVTAADSHALWHVVHDLCVPDMRLTGLPAPCAKVDLPHGYAVVTDRGDPTQMLLVPTVRVTGVEDPVLLAPGSVNYWWMSWQNRQLLAERAGRALEREAIGLVVNSRYGRSQAQLHIHIDCVRPEVAEALADRAAQIGPDWAPLDVELRGRRYLARWIAEADLEASDPFKLVAELPAARADMGRETLALIGATSRANEPGFVLLARQADPDVGDSGHGEDLLDHHACGRPTLWSGEPEDFGSVR